MSNYSFPKIDLNAYLYSLPEELIAQHPSDKRGQSKLLYFDGEKITHHQFAEITNLLPQKGTIFFNDTRVIPARLHFKRKSGAIIEIFILEPLLPSKEIVLAMESKRHCTWITMVGNLKKWKNDEILEASFEVNGNTVTITAQLVDRDKRKVQFNWSEDCPFLIVLDALGKIPLPPYIHRETQKEDTDRYQTVYSHNNGAVAAPTAGLHFTKKIVGDLKVAGLITDYLTLHVGAGTFQPISAQIIEEHPMHAEKIVVTRDNVQNLIGSRFTVAVGTTSLRTLESLYWYGVKLLESSDTEFFIPKGFPYQHRAKLPSAMEALQRIIAHMEKSDLAVLSGVTQIFIVPGYTFKIVEGLITNYHLPGSTLILLVSAFIGDKWSLVYNEAIKRGYKFLSYGDSSLLLKPSN